ncbi:MAG: nucleotidyltransferase domain-containing protein [Spirochaetaceae bacterium]|nr:nucleotidyltransferase domain-containing protein [Spirochaetaceae bacterium]MCF7939459.1 nucleotidyltransferase domain-containing protein [Spirochaetales bacterium]
MWLFGSRARGDCTLDSDYDILIVAEGDPSKI